MQSRNPYERFSTLQIKTFHMFDSPRNGEQVRPPQKSKIARETGGFCLNHHLDEAYFWKVLASLYIGERSLPLYKGMKPNYIDPKLFIKLKEL